MTHVDLGDLTFRESRLRILPTVITYSRLEPLGLTNGDLTPGLQLPIADPLWMLGRQWQFQELQGEDGGSPIVVKVEGESAPVTRFHPGPLGEDPAGSAVDVPGAGVPVEVAVEAETPSVLPERVRAELGLQLLRDLRAAGMPAGVTAAVVGACVAAWPFSGDLDAERDPAGAARRRVVSGRVPDAAAAVTDLAQRSDADGKVTSLPDAVRKAAGTPAHRGTVRKAMTGWLAHARSYVASPVGASWDPYHLEYSFALQADLSSGDVLLRADEYAGGTVDWYSFDAAAEPSLGAPETPVEPTGIHIEAMPTPVRYPGMPSDRLWAFEDAKVYLGGVRAGSPDLARLALLEFSLAYGNDWFLVPVQLPYGDVARVHSLTVVDTFGETIDVGPSREASRPGWTVFQNTPVDDASAHADLFVLPATVRHALEGEPLEEVTLFRDEMANLVWGVEHVVQGESGEPIARGLVESRSLRQQLPDDLDDAAIVYRLMTPVPDHWIPFVSVPVPGVPVEQFATDLVRRPMVRFLEDRSIDVVHPRGVLLKTAADADVTRDFLRIAEEEIPRDGLLLTRRFQLARTADGGSVLWVGRRKSAGRGEGSSGLKFDTALPPGGL